MEEKFLKSALPAEGPFVRDDTSLALPAELSAGASTTRGSNDRSLRVRQQVKLKLAQKSRETVSNGNVRLEKLKAKSFDAIDGSSPYMKVNGIVFFNRPFSSYSVRPSRRVEVSPSGSPELPRSRLPFSNPGVYSTYAPPEPSQSHRVGYLPDHSLGYDKCQRYAFSEVPCGTQLHASMSRHCSVRQRSVRQTAALQTVFAHAALKQSGDHVSHWSQNQTAVKQDNCPTQGQNGMVLGAIQHELDLPRFPQLSRLHRGLRRMSSYPPSVASMEVDRDIQMDGELPSQQIHRQTITTLMSENKSPEMTLKKAVNMLTQDNEESLILATIYIQNQCFKSTDAKRMVYNLHGIVKLLQLLRSDNEEVQRYAAGALRNVVFQTNDIKIEVKENDGVTIILNALKHSRDVETRRQLSGLLWNLSSHDLLKEHLCREALSVLTQSVLVPSSGIFEGENPKDELLADADVFHNATGCLRNLSSGDPDGRKAMRGCNNLIDSLVYYIRGIIADHKTNDKSTENCICILHNLSYQIEEAELPKKYTQDLRECQQNVALDPKTVGCFALHNAKTTEHLDRQSPLLEEKANPRGIEWLWSAITIRMYLSLIACSVHHYTQEVAIGTLQNITAGNGAMSEAIAFTIVKRENGLQHIKKILQEGERDVKRAAISLLKNLSLYQELHPDIVNQVLPEVVQLLPSDGTSTNLPAEVMVSLCQILIKLSESDSQHVRAIFNQGALRKIIRMSFKGNSFSPTRTSKTACSLLHIMWSHRDLHNYYKKHGYRKTDFINARTTKGVNYGNN
ncbi:plakophilin-2 isoform X1 [Channa argus]|uniref:plakophilin-2 isoform X1 n=1 Tax=Channa argus TaxID=215402 RepID=UPI003521BCCB